MFIQLLNIYLHQHQRFKSIISLPRLVSLGANASKEIVVIPWNIPFQRLLPPICDEHKYSVLRVEGGSKYIPARLTVMDANKTTDWSIVKP